tara:strand:- start:818 stop:1159 length:342 start_codon:yes stop_codon:yes gene_type:complete
MPITSVETNLLSRRTGLQESEFSFRDSVGIRRLLNNQSTKACVFLATNSDRKDAPGVCTVYDFRPTGCKSYPIVLDENDSAILDELCSYIEEFEAPTDEDAFNLLNLEEKLKQ